MCRVLILHDKSLKVIFDRIPVPYIIDVLLPICIYTLYKGCIGIDDEVAEVESMRS